jgi:tellurite resistance protein TerC
MLAWILFLALILAFLALDLGVFHRKSHVVGTREALAWSVAWIVLAFGFSVVVRLAYDAGWQGLGGGPDPVDGVLLDGPTAMVKFLTGYVVEKSLSVDNVFVIALIFGSFGVPLRYQHRVLFWGILGALAMRGVMIGAGAVLVARFHWVLYVFGGFLILTGIRMLLMKGDHGDPAQSRVLRWARRVLPVTDRFHGQHFLVRAGSAAAAEPDEPGEAARPDEAVRRARPGTLMLTPLALALILVESADLLFAVDSIPAIFAVTGDPFLVFSSNVFAILGLRSLYFALAGALDRFRHLKTALSLVLLLVGVKMLAAKPLKELLGPSFNLWLLGGILLILAIGVAASWRRPAIAPGSGHPGTL